MQIGVIGNHSGLLEKGEHYIPLEADASNIDEVLECMRDTSMVARMRTAARDAILGQDALRARSFVRNVTELVLDLSSLRGVAPVPESTVLEARNAARELAHTSAPRPSIRSRLRRMAVTGGRAVLPGPFVDACMTSLGR